MAGATLTAADFVQALRLRAELSEIINGQVLRTFDALITATGLTPAARFDEFGHDVTRWRGMLTLPFNVTGSPALAVPIGFAANGLPMGMQVVGRPFDEPTVLRIGAAYEQAVKFFENRPALELRVAV